MTLPAGKDFALEAMKEGYLFHSLHFSLKDVKQGEPFNVSVPLQKIRGWASRKARLPPSAAGAARPSGSAASSSDQGSDAAASSQQDSTSGGGAPPAQSSMPPPVTNRADCAGADQSFDSGSGAAHAATAQDGAGATANAASPRGPD